VKRASRKRPEEVARRWSSPASQIRRARKKAKRAEKPRPLPSEAGPRPRAPRADGAFRVRIVGVLAVVVFASVAGRAAKLQLVDGARYREAAERQASVSAQIHAKRGVIKDRRGAELSITVDVDSVFAEPRRIRDRPAAARALAPVLGLSRADLEKRLSMDRAFLYLRRRVDTGTAERVRALGIDGVGIRAEPKRFYSNIELAAHVLGFTGWDGLGKAGIERTFDGDLRGRSYEVPSLRDALGKKVFAEGVVPQSALEGSDVHLTLDGDIQHAAEEALERAVSAHRAKAGTAIVMDPHDGDVLAMASYPTYNPNNLGKSDANDRLNRAISAVYEPGSTLKMVTIAAALEAGLVEPSTTIDCEGGKWRVGGRTIGDSSHEYDELTVTEILKVSSNICAAKIGFLLGKKDLHAALGSFGFGVRTGIELPGEVDGLIRPYEAWREITLANVAFGQGVAVTPIQIAQATSVIANGGFLVRPRLVAEVVDKSGERTAIAPPKKARVISEATARRVARMMVEVTREGGTAEGAVVPGFAVAGKTGTAQKIDPVTKAYSHELHVSSFVGFVPADRPEVVILVLVDEPSAGSSYGGVVAAPAFSEIAVAALAALEVFPGDEASQQLFLEKHRPKTPITAPNPLEFEENPVDPGALEDSLSASAQALLGFTGPGLEALAEEIEPAAEGESRAERAASRRRAKSGGSALPIRDPTEISRAMPDLRGLTLREVLDRSREIGCDPVIAGSGRVVRTSPGVGTRIEPGAPCKIQLAADL
jgi:cell division protein FtsI (penicillin-binding protein 3)